MADYLAERALRDMEVDQRAWAIRRVRLEALTARGRILAHEAWLGDAPGLETRRALLCRLVSHLYGEDEGVSELTVTLWGLEPAPGRQLSLLEAQESDRQWRQVTRALQRRYPEGLVRVMPADAQAPILAERYPLQRWQA